MNEAIADQRLSSTFHRSIMLTACLSGIILCAAEGRWFPSALTPLFAVFAWLLVDEYKKFSLPLIAANSLGILALMASAAEFASGNIESKLLSGAHLIVYLSWIVLLLRKTPRQYWWVIALCLLQLAVAAVLTSAAGFGASLILMLFVLLWTLSVFSLYRVYRDNTPANSSGPANGSVTPAAFSARATRADILTGQPADHSGKAEQLISVRNGLQRDAYEPWIALRFRGLVVLSFLVSLALSFVVFTAFPRVWVPGSPFASSQSESSEERSGIFHRTGFTETVQLGEIGNLLTSNGRVIQFSITNLRSGQPTSAESFADAMGIDEIRFRGNAMGYYKDGAWSRGLTERGYRRGEEESPHVSTLARNEQADFLIEVTQDPPVSQFAFAVFPVSRIEAASGSGRILQRTVSGSMIWSSSSTIDKDAPRTFTIECSLPDDGNILNFRQWSIPRLIDSFLRSQTQQRIREYASHIFITEELEKELPSLFKISQELSLNDDGSQLPPTQRVERIMGYLAPANGFRYSLSQTRQDNELDPVEDFLLNNKSGHCEYFASACTLMLQSAGVPARLVNGFYGSELNSVTGKHEVKQHHSHAWVEAFVDDQWITLDPVPAGDRQQFVERAKSNNNLLSDLQAAFSDLWSGGIHNMTLEKQRAFFDPVLQFGTSIKQNVEEKGLWEATKAFLSELIRSPRNFFSLQGGAVTFVFLLTCAGLYRLHPLRRMMHIIQMLRERFSSKAVATESVIRFYTTFRKLCASHGMHFSASSTAMENAAAAVEFFNKRLTGTELRSIPISIAETFNRVRFGDGSLDEATMHKISNDLEAFKDALTAESATNKPGSLTSP